MRVRDLEIALVLAREMKAAAARSVDASLRLDQLQEVFGAASLDQAERARIQTALQMAGLEPSPSLLEAEPATAIRFAPTGGDAPAGSAAVPEAPAAEPAAEPAKQQTFPTVGEFARSKLGRRRARRGDHDGNGRAAQPPAVPPPPPPAPEPVAWEPEPEPDPPARDETVAGAPVVEEPVPEETLAAEPVEADEGAPVGVEERGEAEEPPAGLVEEPDAGPVEEPPVEEPLVEEPPVEDPPVEEPPAEEPTAGSPEPVAAAPEPEPHHEPEPHYEPHHEPQPVYAPAAAYDAYATAAAPTQPAEPQLAPRAEGPRTADVAAILLPATAIPVVVASFAGWEFGLPFVALSVIATGVLLGRSRRDDEHGQRGGLFATLRRAPATGTILATTAAVTVLSVVASLLLTQVNEKEEPARTADDAPAAPTSRPQTNPPPQANTPTQPDRPAKKKKQQQDPADETKPDDTKPARPDRDEPAPDPGTEGLVRVPPKSSSAPREDEPPTPGAATGIPPEDGSSAAPGAGAQPQQP